MAQKINLFYLTIITWLVKQPTKAILHGGRNSQVVRYMRYWRHKRRLLWPIYHFRAISLQRNLLANIWATKMGIFRIFQCQRIIHRLSLNPYCLSQTSYLVKRFVDRGAEPPRGDEHRHHAVPDAGAVLQDRVTQEGDVPCELHP